ncbi:MAG: hypothetical protein CGU29_04790 [Candidatus Dactylopiibacterium carminicum]|uniref:AsmA domain-containing protein n=1 Tax=Candidatus Dactylopiibacterium carminicum TaxID=857335 RepID=A0A272EVL4_9RHOO|nr:AsmA family protein [Candidatus Dactylopiibacterium carminicum]KAF7599914.1 hypothetical protein BGI27_05555 [Candidatus Dactylopiibacterium carminicum]PAS94148.1 MAG: hypothetical protein CGU29_04790 [Candidatus Dactylopiibacterium carminicum]
MSRTNSILLRVLGLVLGGICALLLAASLLAWARFDGAQAAVELEQYFKTHYQRTLVMANAPRLLPWPSPTLYLQRLTLSEPRRADVVAQVRELRLRLAWLPLMAGRVEIRAVELGPSSAALIRERDGRWNFADLLADPPTDDTLPWPLKLERIALDKLDLNLLDRGDNTQTQLHDLSLTLDRPQIGSPARLCWQGRFLQPQDAALNLQGNARLTLSPELKAAQLEAMTTRFDGELEGFAGISGELRADTLSWDRDSAAGELSGLRMHASGARGGERREWQLTLPKLHWQDKRIGGEALAARMVSRDGSRSLQVELQLPTLAPTEQGFDTASARLQAQFTQGALNGDSTLGFTLSANPADGQWRVSALDGNCRLQHPALRKAITLGLGGQGSWQPARGGELALQLAQGDQRLTAQASLPRLRPLQARLSLQGDALDFDSLLDPDELPALLAQPLPPEAALSGRLTLAEAQAGGVHWQNLQLPFVLDKGRFSSSGYTASAHGGRFKGDLLLDTTGGRLESSGEFSTIALESLRDEARLPLPAVGKLSGSYRIAAPLAAGRNPLAQAKGALRWRLEQARLDGVDFARSLRELRPDIEAGTPGARRPDTGESSRFDSIVARFVFARGRWQTNNLQAGASWLNISGQGEGSLLATGLDLQLRANVLPAVARGDTRDLAGLRGKTLPLRLKGPNMQPDIRYEHTASR